MKSKKILLCGYFAFGTQDNGGQPVKARETYYALCERYGKENIIFVDTIGWKRKPFHLLYSILHNARLCDYIIMLPARNGVLVFSHILILLQRLKKKKIYYDVIGGWLPELLVNNSKLKNRLLRFNGIWVETSSMKKRLDEMNFKNVSVLPNFKKLRILNPEELEYNYAEPYKVCTFSRVMPEKGILDAIDAVTTLNAEYGRIVYTLDIYGQIDNNFLEQFTEIKKSFPDYICYKGVVQPNESVNTIKKYFALLFPTHFYTEGIPGTILDAYSAGVPVISARWLNCVDILKENVTGWGYDFDNPEGLKMLLKRALNNPNEFLLMKEKCLTEANCFNPQSVINLVDKLLNE